MRSKVIRSTTFILSIILITAVVLAGCGKKDNEENETEAATTKAAGEKTTAAEEQAEPVELKLLVQMPAEFVPEDNPIVEALEKGTNTKLEFEIAPQNSFQERINIVLASGSYPDIMQFARGINETSYINAFESGVILPITEHVNNSQNLKKYLDPTSLKALELNGNGDIYAVPRNTLIRADGLIVRKDWLDKVGYTLPEDGNVTLDEFKEILRRFTKEDPDGNGKDDTYGISGRSSGGNLSIGSLTNVLYGAFDVMGWQRHEGEYDYMVANYCRERDNYKKLLEYVAGLWQEGLIDPNWPITKGSGTRDRFYSGNAGMVSCFGGWVYTFDKKLKSNFPDAETTYIYGIKDSEGKVKSYSIYGANIYGVLAVTTTAKGKEKAAVGFFDYLLSDEGWNILKYGVEGIHYNRENGNVAVTEEFNNYNKYRSHITLLRRYNDPEYFVPANAPQEYRIRMNRYLARTSENCVPTLDMGYVTEAQKDMAFVEYQSTMSETVSKIILGDLPSSAWDDALDKWYDANGKEVIEEMNAYLKGIWE